ncbi:MAG: hypothetical protein ILA34_01515 [Bacteroidaceae bacterium]|nr:hypothetical protein [Bacteroidaceae bacterium]
MPILLSNEREMACLSYDIGITHGVGCSSLRARMNVRWVARRQGPGGRLALLPK